MCTVCLSACLADAGELVRIISEKQAAADLEAIRGMWELAAVYEFMAQFKYWLNFSQLYPLQDLEEAIVKSPGPGRTVCNQSVLHEQKFKQLVACRPYLHTGACRYHSWKVPCFDISALNRLKCSLCHACACV